MAEREDITAPNSDLERDFRNAIDGVFRRFDELVVNNKPRRFDQEVPIRSYRLPIILGIGSTCLGRPIPENAVEHFEAYGGPEALRGHRLTNQSEVTIQRLFARKGQQQTDIFFRDGEPILRTITSDTFAVDADPLYSERLLTEGEVREVIDWVATAEAADSK